MGFVQKFKWRRFWLRLVQLTMDKKEVERVEMVGQSDKHQITAVLYETLEGDNVSIQLVYKGKTNHCHLSNNSISELMAYHPLSQSYVNRL